MATSTEHHGSGTTDLQASPLIPAYHLPAAELLALADFNRERFLAAEPFPHVVFDDFLPEWVLDKVIAEFPDPGAVPWKEFKQASAKKLASEGDAFFGDFTRHLTAEFNSATFLQFLERLTGIEGLIADPYFFGGGLHQIETGGFLKVHVDFNRHETLKVDRRLNAIVYLNRDWDPAWGGGLELWDADMTRAVETVLPLFNRCVIFATPNANHGHPDPISCPPDRRRRSLAFFYYRNDLAGEEELEDHESRYRERPGEKIRSSTIVIKRITPPVLLDLARQLRNRSAK
jgi:hypothetical protein